jgi:hypothetical protein
MDYSSARSCIINHENTTTLSACLKRDCFTSKHMSRNYVISFCTSHYLRSKPTSINWKSKGGFLVAPLLFLIPYTSRQFLQAPMLHLLLLLCHSKLEKFTQPNRQCQSNTSSTTTSCICIYNPNAKHIWQTGMFVISIAIIGVQYI